MSLARLISPTESIFYPLFLPGIFPTAQRLGGGHRWVTSTRKIRVLASKRVSGTRVLTRYTFFYFQLLEYS